MRYDVEDLPWDSGQLGMSCARVVPKRGAYAAGELPDLLARRGVALARARIPADRGKWLAELAPVLPQQVGTMVEMSTGDPLTVEPAEGIVVREATEEHLLAVRHIAAARYYSWMDHVFPSPILRRELYAQWAENNLRGRTTRMGVAVSGGMVVGFVAVDRPLGGPARIDLIVSAEPGLGVGRSLLAWIDQIWPYEKSVGLMVRLDNHSALALYRSAGFRPTGPAYVDLARVAAR